MEADCMKKKSLEAVLKEHEKEPYHFTKDASDYHEASEVVDVLEAIMDYGDEEVEKDELEEAIQEQADSQTPVYNNDLAGWFAENWMAYDEVAEEMGKDNMGEDIMRSIAMAYCITLQRDATSALEVLWEEAEEYEEKQEEADAQANKGVNTDES